MMKWMHIFAITFLIRVIVIIVTTTIEEGYIESIHQVKFTDIDYSVYHDAAALMVKGQSPYERYTYRYPPLLAYLLQPNITLHRQWGKYLFSFFDSLISVMIYAIISHNQPVTTSISSIDFKKLEEKALFYSWLWSVNVFSIVICTRGSSDAISNFATLLFVYLLLGNHIGSSGLILGFLIYWRIYPIIYLSTAIVHIYKRQTSVWKGWMPLIHQLSLFGIGVVTMVAITVLLSYYYYGKHYLQEAVLYHSSRLDFRHNFSLYFLPIYQYISSISIGPTPSLILTTFIQFSFLPQLAAVLVVLIPFYRNQFTLPTTLLLQTFLFVIYNKVITAQYFTWFICFMPIVFSSVTEERCRLTSWIMRAVMISAVIWLSAMAVWLYEAYQLEFNGQNTFIEIWMASIGFHVASVGFIVCLMKFLAV